MQDLDCCNVAHWFSTVGSEWVQRAKTVAVQFLLVTSTSCHIFSASFFLRRLRFASAFGLAKRLNRPKPRSRHGHLHNGSTFDFTGSWSKYRQMCIKYYILVIILVYIYILLNGGLFIYFFFAAGLGFFWGSWFYAFLFLWFSASLLFYFSAYIASLLFCFLLSLLLCFSCFSAFLLFAFPASLLFCFSVFPASLLLYFCAFLLLLFYFFFSSVMCFCCSTYCSFASLLPVFTVSLFFVFFCFILFCLYPKWNPRETLGESQRNPKEILIRNPTWSHKWTLKKP